MIKIECDNCERTFEVEDEKGGEKVPCPFCDDVNRVPKTESSEGRAMPVVDDDEEREICVVRPAMFRAHPFKYLFIVSLIIGGLALTLSAKISESVPAWLMWPGLIISAFTLVWFAVWWIRNYFWLKLIVTNKRSIRQEGIIRRHTTEVLHDHIRSVDIKQKLLNRLLKVGDIDIDSAGQASHGKESNIEISMYLIPRPYEVKKIIDQYRMS